MTLRLILTVLNVLVYHHPADIMIKVFVSIKSVNSFLSELLPFQ